MQRFVAVAVVLAVMGLGIFPLGCSSNAGPAPAAPACDQACQDAVGLRAFRETLKQVFNGALQDMPVGTQDRMYDCMPLGGTAHITGTATSDPNVGTTTVNLTYVLDHCHYLAVDTDPTQNYDITLTGTTLETGVIAVQPGTTTALTLTADAMTFSGTVYSPALPYAVGPCAVQLSQNGNQLSGLVCGRTAGLTL